MNTALAGLVGAAIGALATGLIQIGVAASERARSGRTAARLVQSGLRWAVWR
jgi:hypothetical protein